jgi:outer membrane beta-barrel protein
MNQARIGLLVAAALLATPGLAQAQDKPAADEAAPAEGAKGGEEKPTEGGEEGSSICELDPSQCPQIDIKEMAKRPIQAQMYAVQQKYALRVRRFEFNPYYITTVNDQFVSHPGFGLAGNFYFSDVMAVGLNFNFNSFSMFGQNAPNFNRDSEFNAQTRRASRIGVPLTEYDWSTSLNFTYVPMYGKFSGFNYFIFHYDAYVVGGIGLVSNRPIAVIDPDNRSFQSKLHLAPNVGLGLRIFFNRWFAAIFEVRDYIFLDSLENTVIDANKPQDESTWYAKDSTLTNHVQAQIGLSVFLPFSFEYRLPK